MTPARTVGFSSGIFQIREVPHTGQCRKEAACPGSPHCTDDAWQGFVFASTPCCQANTRMTSPVAVHPGVLVLARLFGALLLGTLIPKKGDRVWCCASPQHAGVWAVETQR